MPVPKGTTYRMRPMKGGGFERIGFSPGGKVVETKNMKSGATHSAAEFKADRKAAAKRKK